LQNTQQPLGPGLAVAAGHRVSRIPAMPHSIQAANNCISPRTQLEECQGEEGYRQRRQNENYGKHQNLRSRS
jgi:hypothetical protein